MDAFVLRRGGSFASTNSPFPAPQPSIEIYDDGDGDDVSELTTAISGDTPTLPGDAPPSIRALQEASTDAEYDQPWLEYPLNKR